MIKQDIDSLLQKKMDRLTFIKHVGVGFAAIAGVATVVKSMNGLGGGPGSSARVGAANTYGTSAYGGASNRP